MKKVNALFTICLIAVSATTVNAQKYTEGDKTLSFLAGEKLINIEYSYDNMMVGKKTEEEYKAGKIVDYNTKVPGKGDKWAVKWVENRENVYEPMFEELINKIMVKAKMEVKLGTKQTEAKYTLLVHTTLTEPGFTIPMVMKVNPYCNYEFTWMETSSRKVMAKGELNKVAGVVMADNEWEFDPANRIKECYAKAGKVVGKSMEKVLKPKK
ncbi:MAG: hypothetical protein ABI763_06550 [Bacteroidota bacterium]